MQKGKRPLVISHRGYSSVFPENTLQSIELSLYNCNLIEFDILLTKDHQIIIFHDRHLSQITNVADFQEFKDRKRKGAYNGPGTERDDWWVSDFTLQELKRLTVRQYHTNRPQYRHLKFSIPTLEEGILEVLQIKKTRLLENNCGFLVQVKGLWQYEDDQWDLKMVSELSELLRRLDMDSEKKCKEKRFPIVIQSFKHTLLKNLGKTNVELPIVHLFDKVEKITEDFLKERTVKNMIGIGITEEHATIEIRQLCDKFKWLIFYWTMVDDREKLPFGAASMKQAYFYLMRLGINGIITEFPEKCIEYMSEMYRD